MGSVTTDSVFHSFLSKVLLVEKIISQIFLFYMDSSGIESKQKLAFNVNIDSLLLVNLKEYPC